MLFICILLKTDQKATYLTKYKHKAYGQTFQECSFDGLATISSHRFMEDPVGNQSLEGPLQTLCFLC